MKSRVSEITSRVNRLVCGRPKFNVKLFTLYTSSASALYYCSRQRCNRIGCKFREAKETVNASTSYDWHEKWTVQTGRNMRFISNHIYCNKIKYFRNVCKNIENSCKPLQKVRSFTDGLSSVILNNNNRLSY